MREARPRRLHLTSVTVCLCHFIAYHEANRLVVVVVQADVEGIDFIVTTSNCPSLGARRINSSVSIIERICFNMRVTDNRLELAHLVSGTQRIAIDVTLVT